MRTTERNGREYMLCLINEHAQFAMSYEIELRIFEFDADLIPTIHASYERRFWFELRLADQASWEYARARGWVNACEF